MKILVIGDIVGRPGRRAVATWLPTLIDKHNIDYCIANGENASGGMGLDANAAHELLSLGIDVLTLGNHAFAKKQIVDLMNDAWPIVRPANGPASWPGQGHLVLSKKHPVAVININGRAFMDGLNDPFESVDKIVTTLQKQRIKCIIVDFHAEATAEKQAMAHFLKDRVSAVVGTHTHVQTADERIVGQGTAYITDIGMTGPYDSIIGMNIDASLTRFVKRLPSRYEVADGRLTLQGVIIELDAVCGQARRIERVLLIGDEP